MGRPMKSVLSTSLTASCRHGAQQAPAPPGQAGAAGTRQSALCLWVARSPAHWNRARLWLLGSPSQVSTPPTTSPPRTEPLPASAAGTATGRLRGAPRIPGAAWAALQSVLPPRAHLCVTLVEEAHEREAAGLAGGVVLQPERAAGVREGSWGRRACAHRGACCGAHPGDVHVADLAEPGELGPGGGACVERVSGACKSGWASTLTLGSGRDARSGTRNSCGALLPAGDTHQVAHVVLRGAEAQVVHLRGQIRAGEEQGKGPGASGRGAQLGRTHTLRDTMLLMSGGPRGAPSAMAAGVLAKGGLRANVDRAAHAHSSARTMSETLQLRGVLKGHEGACRPACPAARPRLTRGLLPPLQAG